MLTYPEIDPIIVDLGYIQLRWYSLMYIIGLITVFVWLRRGVKVGTLDLNEDQVEKIMIYGLVGMILGARLTYVFVYNFPHYWANPGDIVAVWKGGLSFHGGFIGVITALLIFAKIHKISYLNLCDHCAVAVPVGIGFGRIGNFINGELWGRVTDAPIGMVFPSGGPLPRHPSQLYESALEGWLLLVILYFLHRSRPKLGVTSAGFVLGYATFRFIVEFFRQPDEQLGTVLGPFSMGQVLCSIMWLFGGFVLLYVLNRGEDPPDVQRRKAAEAAA